MFIPSTELLLVIHICIIIMIYEQIKFVFAKSRFVSAWASTYVFPAFYKSIDILLLMPRVRARTTFV